MKNESQYFHYMEIFPQMFEKPFDAGIELVTDRDHIRDIETTVKSRLREKGQPEEWADVGVVFQDTYMTVLRDAVIFKPSGVPGTYIRQFNSSSACGVVILPIFNGKVCLLRIFRHALRKFAFELPRGFGVDGQTNEENATRELAEEIGGEVKELHSLGVIAVDSGIGNIFASLFFAELQGELKSSESDEGIDKIMLVSIKEFLCMIRDGEIYDSFTLAATVRAVLQGYLKA